MTAIGRATERGKAEPPTAVMGMYVNVLSRNKFSRLPAEFLVAYAQRLGEESGINPVDTGQHRTHGGLLPGLDHRVPHRRSIGRFPLGRASMPYGSMSQGSDAAAITGAIKTTNGSR